MLVHFIGRDDHTRTRLLDLSSLRRLQCHHQVLIPPWLPLYHCHSFSSNPFDGMPSSSSSSLATGAAARKISFQSSRGRRSGEMTRHSFSTRKSTFSPNPHCSISVFGM